MPLRRAPEALICPGAPRASSTEGRAAVRSGVLRQVEALLLPHLADDDEGGPHAQRLLHQPAQRDLPGALEVGLAGLHGDHVGQWHAELEDRKSTRLNSSHANISYAVFCLKKKNKSSRLRHTSFLTVA